MITIMVSSSNARELQVIDAALTQRRFKVVQFDPTFVSYIKMMQYSPDVIIMEMLSVQQIDFHFIDFIRGHKRLAKVPIIAFGGQIEAMLRNGIIKRGVNDYIVRPLKFGMLLKLIEDGLKRRGKSMEIGGKAAPSPEFNSAMMFDPQVLPMKKIEAMGGHVGRLMAFPFTVGRIMKITNSEDKGAVELANVIQADPVIATQMMKVSNSVFYTSMNRRISTVKDAIVRIGFLETKKIVMGIAVMDVFKSGERNAGFNRVEFWHHSLACAIIAERLAKRMGDLNRDEAFLAGLIHDIGILIFDEYFPDVFRTILGKTTEEGADFIAEERAMLGFTHLDLTVELFTRWKLHEDMTYAIVKREKAAELATANLTKPGDKMAVCLWLAETLAKTLFIGSECDQFIRPPAADVFKLLKLATGIGKNFIDEICQELKVLRQFFNMPVVEFPARFESISGPENVHAAVINEPGDVFLPPALYLHKEGVQVDVLTPDAAVSNTDGRYDIIIVWCDLMTPKEKIERYKHIVKKHSDSEPSGPNAALAPVLVCVDNSSALPKDEVSLNVSFVPKEIDMRNLDYAVVETMKGGKVKYKEYTVAAAAQKVSALDPAAQAQSAGPVAS